MYRIPGISRMVTLCYQVGNRLSKISFTFFHSLIFTLAFLIESRGAAVLGGLKIPYNQQQFLIAPLAPNRKETKSVFVDIFYDMCAELPFFSSPGCTTYCPLSRVS